MKILRVSLRNLNSLRGENVVDFAEGPLAEAGLFAITGPMGAGKSTLLDAITLALYGRAARYDGEANPENMMSRHTGECQAEVVFAVPAGRFRAAWHLSRARKKPAGKVQPAKRYLYDDQGQALTQLATTTDQKIVELTGLDYERFLRSVMLAQGDFARFLKADATKRAELLESLTGTSVYSQLGELAHLEATWREEGLRQEESALAALTPLPDNERAAKLTAHEHLGREQTAGTEQLAQLTERWHRGTQCRELAGILQRLQTEQAALQKRVEASAPEVARLERHRLAQPFCADLARLEQGLEEVKRAQQLLETGQTSALQARKIHAETLAGTQALAREEAGAATRALAAQLKKIETGVAEVATVRNWLTAQAADGALADALPALAGDLAKLEGLWSEETGLRAECAKLAKKSEEWQAGRRAGETTQSARQTAVENRRSEAETTAKELAGVLEGKTPEALQGELATAQLGLRTWEALSTLLTRADEEAAKAVAAEQEAEGHSRAVAAQGDVLAARLTDLAPRQALGEALAGQLMKTKLLHAVAVHRPALRPGEACPLCGALEHPLAEAAPMPEEIEELEAKLRAAAQDEKSARAAVGTAEAENTRLQGRQQQAAARALEARTRETAAREEAKGLDAQASMATEAKARVQTAETIVQRLQATIQQAQQRQTDAEQRRHALLEAESLLKEQQSLLEATKKSRAELSLRQEALAEEQAAKQKAVATQEAALATLLRSFSLALPALGEAEQLRAVLAARAQKFREESTRLATLENHLEHWRVEEKAQSLRVTQATLAADDLAARPLPKELDQPAVARRRLRWASLADASSALQEAASAEQAEGASLATLTAALHAARTRAWALEQSLLERLRDSPFADLAGLRAAQLDAAEAVRSEKLETELANEQRNLGGRRELTEEQLAQLRAEGAPEREAFTQLAAEREALQQKQLERAGALARAEAEIQHDDATRLARSERAARLAGALEELVTWRRLRELIGSQHGAKFSRFAQGLSLDLLLGHANRHLATLSDRYHLQRMETEELNLHIVDHYQADATRPMASLSGGESFLASLALALGLSDLAGRTVRIDSLFVDEGFGSLDAETLEVAVAALESLRARDKTVGIISHVELLKERIPTQVRVRKHAEGFSTLEIVA